MQDLTTSCYKQSIRLCFRLSKTLPVIAGQIKVNSQKTNYARLLVIVSYLPLSALVEAEIPRREKSESQLYSSYNRI